MSTIIQKVDAMVNLLNGKIDNAPAYRVDGRFHAWEILKNKPGTAKIAVGFQSAKARVNFKGGDITGRDDQYYYAIVSRGKGLNADRSANVFEGSGGGKPLLEIAETMRDGLRAIRFDPVTDEQPDYVEMGEWGLNEGFNIDAYQVKIWVGTQLPLFNPLQAQIEPT